MTKGNGCTAKSAYESLNYELNCRNYYKRYQTVEKAIRCTLVWTIYEI